MRSTLFKANKLLLIEKNRQAYVPANCLPLEYTKIVIPHAGLYFRSDEECEILSQHINAGPFSLWLHDIFAKHDIVLLPYTPYHIWTLHFMYEDSVLVEGSRKVPFMLEERECNLFNIYPGIHRVPMKDNTKVLSVHINIRPEFHSRLSEKYPQLGVLLTRPAPAVNCALNAHAHHINPVCDLIIQKILTCKYTGRKAHAFIYRCCLDLLLNYATQEAHVHEPFLFSSLEHQDTYQQLFRLLVEHPHRTFSVAELSEMYKLPATELSSGFLQHYSITIEDFSLMLKMMMTYNLLHRQSWSNADIASAVGFSSAAEMFKQVEAYYECKPGKE